LQPLCSLVSRLLIEHASLNQQKNLAQPSEAFFESCFPRQNRLAFGCRRRGEFAGLDLLAEGPTRGVSQSFDLFQGVVQFLLNRFWFRLAALGFVVLLVQ